MIAKRWFYSEDLKPKGPFTREELQSLVFSGVVSLDQLVLDDHDGVWRPAREWRHFVEAADGKLPQNGASEVKTEKKTELNFIENEIELSSIVPHDPREEERQWILLMPLKDGAQFLQEGPYSARQIKLALRENQITQNHFVWRPGMSEWKKVSMCPEIAEMP